MLLAFGQFVAFTYLAPIVREHTGLTGTGLSAVLLAYGVAGVVAFARLGAMADRRPRAALLSCCALIVTGLAVIVVISHGTVPLIFATLAWGAGFTALPVFLQSAVLRVAPEMPDTASSVFVVSFQIGIGGGALVGSGLLGSGHLTAIPQLALVLFVAGSAVAAVARRTFGGGDASRRNLERLAREDELLADIATIQRSGVTTSRGPTQRESLPGGEDANFSRRRDAATASANDRAGATGSRPRWAPQALSVPQWIGTATLGRMRATASAARSGSRCPAGTRGPQPPTGRRATSTRPARSDMPANRSVSPAK